MPDQTQNPALMALKAQGGNPTDPWAQAQQRMDVQGKMAGVGGQPQAPPMQGQGQAPQGGGFSFSNPNIPDVMGLIEALKKAGIMGSRPQQDIELPPEPLPYDELMARAKAIQ